MSSIVVCGERLVLPDGVVRLGIGVCQRDESSVVTTRFGVGAVDAFGRIGVITPSRRYSPALHDVVIGVVASVEGDRYRVDIGASALATLYANAFDGAAKRLAPLKVGDVVYARVLSGRCAVETVVTCSGENFGALSAGVTVEVSQKRARALILDASSSDTDDKANVFLQCGRFADFEVAVGVNGRVWIAAASARACIAVANAVVNSGAGDVSALVEAVFAAI